MFGKRLKRLSSSELQNIGAMVEIPAFYPYLSGYDNLEIARLACGVKDVSRIDELLKQVGIYDRRKSLVSGYSQGMRQRLGIAQALMHRPCLVFLDEPTNGLDPNGIREIRELIVQLNREENVTFVISSHLLHEVELMCTRVGMIHQGSLVVEKDIESILLETSGYARVRVDDETLAMDCLKGLAFCSDVAHGDEGLRFKVSPDQLAASNRALIDAGVNVNELMAERLSLEAYFLEKVAQA